MPTPTLSAIAEDLRFWVWLLREPKTVETWVTLSREGFPEGLVLSGDDADARTLAHESINALATLKDEQEINNVNDELAAEYTAIFVAHQYKVSPMESVWKDEDQLAWQEATFTLRKAYQEAGFQAKNWRDISEDHLLAQLEFLALRLEAMGDDGVARQALAKFMHEHINSWLALFTERVHAATCIPLYYAVLEMLTQALKALELRLAR